METTGTTATDAQAAQQRLPSSMVNRTNTLLSAVSKALTVGIKGADPRELFNDLLDVILDVTESEYGFIGEVFYDADGSPYVKTRSITNIAWNNETRSYYEQYAAEGLEFRNLATLWGAVLTSGRAVISNSPQTDSRAIGTPSGHPPLRAFMGLPFHCNGELVGLVGVANRADGYDEEIAQFLEPLLHVCASVIDAKRNIRQRKEVEISLQTSEERLRLLTESMQDCVSLSGTDRRSLYVSPSFLRLTGYTAEELAANDFRSRIHPDDLSIAERMREANLRGENTCFEWRCRCRDGSYLWFETTGNPIQAADGRVEKIACCSRDITVRKRLEEFNSNRNRVLQQLARGAPVGKMLETLVQAVETHVPEMVCSILLLDRANNCLRIGSAPSLPDFYNDAIDGIDIGPTVGSCGAAASMGCPVFVRDVSTHPNWTAFREVAAQAGLSACWSIPIHSSGGEVLGTLAIYYGTPRLPNADERKLIDEVAHLAGIAIERAQVVEELRQANEEAVAASRSKSEFLANMSHEIRTPMTAILGFTDVLLESLVDEDQIAAASTIRRNGNHLLEIINDILDLSKIEADRLDVEQIPCSPIEIVRDVVSLMQVRADAKGLPLIARFDGPLPETIHSDPTRLRQILINIVGNAVKFTSRGRVEITTSLTQLASGPHMRFEVRDTGIGISAEQQQRLFQPFSQADSSMSRQFGGTGLGLAICKRLAELLDGEISVESRPAEGSCFAVTVATGPLDNIRMIEPGTAAECRESFRPNVNKTPRLDCRVLLADDGPDNQRLISFLLKKAGADVEVVDNGQQALEAAMASLPGRGHRHTDPDRPFDVILMDMQMPVLDGYSATRQLRAAGYAGPIIAITAHAMTGDRDKCLEAGCDDYIRKPIDRNALIEMVSAYSAQQAQTPESKMRSPNGTGQLGNQ